MRVAFVDWFCDPARPGASGLSDLVWGMALALAGIGHDVSIVAPYSQKTVDALHANSGVKISTMPAPTFGYRNIVGHLLLAELAKRQVKRLGPIDIIHTVEYLSSAVLLSIRDLHVPTVLTTPGNIYERIHMINHFDWTATAAYKWAARITASRSEAIVATSQSMQDWWEYSGARSSKIVQIPLGVDTHGFSPKSNARDLLRLGSQPIVLYIGRLQGENGVARLLSAFPRVLEEEPASELHVVGDGPDKAELLYLAQRLEISDSIIWHGRVPFSRLPLYYSAADVFAFPRISRVTPRVMFEAMSCRTPVIASDIDGICDFIVNNQTGLLCDTANPKQFAEAIIRVLQDGMFAEQLGITAARYAKEHLDWHVICQRLIDEVYRPLMASSFATGV